MIKTKNKMIRYIIFLAVSVLIMLTAGLVSSASTDDFEASIADFPENYKPYLRELHKKYPNWIFEAFDTGLEWDTVIDNEVGTKNLTEHASSSENLKSKESGHYNQSTGAYVQKDGGFVVANRLAVEYYMDPRNFLNEEGIFQFEQLTYSDAVTIEDVESVLKGTFMYSKKITYYTSSGEKKTDTKTYSQVIYDAGKTYDVNPCYLASKIRNEIGADGSASVSGKHSVYPGIYNFYNIGATDGTGAITRGLQWASTGTSYSRPWNTPMKAIKGGAAYISEKYIDKGQFTGYLQKFNVNKATKMLYLHQYMTNLSGACSQGYTSYTAYAKTGSLYQAYLFSIPVYKNMPSEDIGTQKGSNADSLVQYAQVSADYTRVRTGPSTNNAKLYDQSGKEIKLYKGAEVQILLKTATDSKYYVSMLQYPHWVQIKFTYNSKSYTGYVPEDFVQYTSYTSVGTGTYTINYFSGNKVTMGLVSSNSAIAKVTSKNTVNFLKKGTVYLTAYDSTGRYDIVKYVVSDSTVAKPKNLKATPAETSIKVTFDKVTGASKYDFGICDVDGNIVSSSSATKPEVTFSSLKKGTKYTVIVRTLLDKTTVNVYSASTKVSSTTKNTTKTPGKVTNFKAEVIGEEVKFTWSKATDCTGYTIYGYNVADGKYVKVTDALSTWTSIVVEKYTIDFDKYYIRAYNNESGQTVYGAYSDPVTVDDTPAVPANLKVSDVKTNAYTLNWDKVTGAESYKIYIMEGTKATFLADSTTNSYTVKSLTPGTEKSYGVAAVKKNSISDVSKSVTAMTLPAKVSGLVCERTTDTEAVIYWADATGASYYIVYMLKDGKYTKVAECEDIKYKFTGLGELTQYDVKVAAVVKGNKLTKTGSQSSALKFTTTLSKVVDLTVDNVRGNNVTLSWQSNPKASKYAVYIYSDNTYVEKAVTTNSYATVTGLEYNKQYSFAVRAIAEKDGASFYSEYSDSTGAMTTYPIPENIQVTNVKTASYTLTWDKVANAKCYKIYRLKGDSYELLKSVTENSYTVSNLAVGQMDSYKITAVYKVGSDEVESDYSIEIIAATTPPKAKTLEAVASTKSVTLTWSAVKNANSYNIYIYENGQYVLYGSTKNTTLKVTGLSEGKEYEFGVRAYMKLTGSTIKSAMTTVKTTTKPAKVGKLTIGTVKTTSHILSWSKTAGANYYYVYRYSSSKKAYERVAKTDKLSYTFTGLTAGTTYSYKVKGVYMKNGKEVTVGAISDVFKFSTNPAQVKNVKSSAIKTTTLDLGWTKVSGANYYEVCIYNSTSGKYVTYSTTDTNKITVKNRKSGTTYKFKVRAVRKVGSDIYYGGFSSVISVKTK